MCYVLCVCVTQRLREVHHVLCAVCDTETKGGSPCAMCCMCVCQQSLREVHHVLCAVCVCDTETGRGSLCCV